jgi:hypothetical protein
MASCGADVAARGILSATGLLANLVVLPDDVALFFVFALPAWALA